MTADYGRQHKTGLTSSSNDLNATTFAEDRYGFRWGPLVVQRGAEFERQDNGPHRVLRLIPDSGPRLDIYVSPTGRSVRVFRDGKELT